MSKNEKNVAWHQTLQSTRRRLKKYGVQPRPPEEEAFLREAFDRVYEIRQRLGKLPRVVLHHCIKETFESGGHVPGNLCILRNTTHMVWHHADWMWGTPLSLTLEQALASGEVIPHPTLDGLYVEACLMEEVDDQRAAA